MAEQLNQGYCDIIMSGLMVTTGRAMRMEFTDPYLKTNIAFVVEDHRIKEFSSRQSLKKTKNLKVAAYDAPYWIEMAHKLLPEAQVIPVQRAKVFFDAKKGTFDAFLYNAEQGAAWTLLYPEYGVAVPKPDPEYKPMAYPVAKKNDDFRVFINTWIELRKDDHTITELYNYWVLGEPRDQQQPRWCILHNVLGRDE